MRVDFGSRPVRRRIFRGPVPGVLPGRRRGGCGARARCLHPLRRRIQPTGRNGSRPGLAPLYFRPSRRPPQVTSGSPSVHPTCEHCVKPKWLRGRRWEGRRPEPPSAQLCTFNVHMAMCTLNVHNCAPMRRGVLRAVCGAKLRACYMRAT